MVSASCCVPGCLEPKGSMQKKNFHKIPLRSREIWLRKIGREDLLKDDSKFIPWKHVICSNHFSQEQYCNTIENEKGKKLRKFAVPDLLPECDLHMDSANPSGSQNPSECIPTILYSPSILLHPKNDVGSTEVHADLDIALETVIPHSDADEKSLQEITQVLMPEILTHDMLVPEKTASPEILEKVKQKLCRVCGNNDLNLIPIVEDLTTVNLFNIPLIRMMQMYLPIQVNINDPFPSNICIICLCILKQWHKLYTTCIAADKVFRDTFCQEKNQDENDIQQCSNVIENCESALAVTVLPSDDHDYIGKQLENQERKEEILQEEHPDVSTAVVGKISINELKKSTPAKKKRRRMVVRNTGNSCVTNEISANIQENVRPPKKKKMKCKNCWETFVEKIEFDNHLQVCKSGPIICEKCGRMFSNKNTYHHHIYLYHSGKVRMCEKCGKCLPLSKFRHHANMEHPETQYCDMCCIVLRSLKEFKSHMRRHSRGQAKRLIKIEPLFQDENTIFQCPVCTQTFSDKSTLIEHLNEFKYIQCPRCFVKVRNERGYILHQCKTVMSCQFCSKTFRCKAVLTAHERIHTGEKPIRCQFCSKSFRTHHLKMQHQKIHFAPSYKCTVCSKMFRRPACLRVHEKTHCDKL